MKWFYEWRLKKVSAEIAALEETTKVRLLDDYTGHSRLRVLRRMQESLQRKLARTEGAPRNVPASVPISVPVSVAVSEVKEMQEAS